MAFLDKIISDLHPNNLRYLFYLVTPNETIFERTEDIPNYTEKSSMWFLILMLLEYSLILLRGKGRFALNDTLTSVNAGMLSMMFKFGGRYLSIHLYSRIYDRFHLIDLPKDSVWTWLLCFFTQDLMYYLGHRAIHEAGVFWSFHQMHHSSEYYNLSTALRQGAIQDIGMSFFDCLQAWAIPPNIFLVHKYLEVVYQFWIHTELVPYLGPLEYFLNTPSSHRVHHGRNPYCIDKNYGGTLIIWDRLFGTYEPERSDEKIAYGLVTTVKSFDQMWLQFFEFKALGWDKGQMRDDNGKELFPGFWNKVSAAVLPPGYFPGTRIKSFFLWFCMQDSTDGIPEVEKPIQVYNPPISSSVSWYVFFQWFVGTVVAMHFNDHRDELSWTLCALMCLFIFVTMQSVGYFFDKRDFAIQFEVSRLVGLLLYCFVAWNSVLVGVAVASLVAIPFLSYP